MRALAIVHQRDAGPGVFTESMRGRGVQLDCWLPAESDEPPADPAGYDAVLTLGGAMHADEEDRHRWLADEKALLAELVGNGTPLLAVCLGAQLLADAAGGTARRAAQPEIGWHQVTVGQEGAEDPVLGPLAPAFPALQWHSYELSLPPGAAALAHSSDCLQAYRVGERAWGIQFHAEVTLRDFEAWLDDYRSDPDAVRIGLDAEALRSETRGAIGRWNELGRGLCDRFLDVAASRA